MNMAHSHYSDEEVPGGDDNSRSTDAAGDDDNNNVHHKKENEVVISKEETKVVFRIKTLVLLVIGLSTLGVALAVYFFVSGAEHEEFDRDFEDHETKVFESFSTTLAITMGAIDSFTADLVSFAKYSNSTWPFVTQPDFAVRASKLRSLTKSIVITEYPLVTSDERTKWENYSIANDAWVDEALRVQAEDPTYEGLIVDEWSAAAIIDESEDGRDHLPSWLSSPCAPIYTPYNWDLATARSLSNAVTAVLSTKTIVIGESLNVEENSSGDGWIAQFLGDEVDSSQPYTAYYFPILDNAVDSAVSQQDSEGNIVAILAVTIFWRKFMEDILPEGSNGITVVVQNDCDQAFTYQINGPDAVYIGPGDLHNGRYDGLMKKYSFVDIMEATQAGGYIGVPLNEEHCPHYLYIYPSDVMKDSYTSNDPILFMFASVLIFMFTATVFVIYDCYVERRQRVVLRTAVQSSNVVSSLFPSNVRDRLFAEGEDKEAKNVEQNSRLKAFLNGGGDMKTDGGVGISAPIAELFPATTIMFADIVGFTNWCSSRDPIAVFTLLEGIYGAFDSVARRRGVFKVETIGDSYVAVVGLPEPRKDHAVVMVKFARDCRSQMAAVTQALASTLGEDTTALGLRIGLHSGPVTAGVLRGDKGRFQLFGDSVNTSARMESNGIKHKIQVSQATADLLMASGKDHWVTPREETIVAKGKGEMQTYWVEPIEGMTTDLEDIEVLYA